MTFVGQVEMDPDLVGSTLIVVGNIDPAETEITQENNPSQDSLTIIAWDTVDIGGTLFDGNIAT